MLGDAPSDIESGYIDSGYIESGLVDLGEVGLADLDCESYPADSAFHRSLQRILAAAENLDEDMAGFNASI